MTATILSYKDCGPIWKPDRAELQADSLTEFIKRVRSCFEDQVNAVAIIKNGVATAMWLAEPDIDCDSDGFYEVKPAYPGQEYVLYTEDDHSFWNLIAGYFGSRYIPSDVGFIAKFPVGKSTTTTSLGDGSESLTAAERNPSMLRR